MSIAARIEPPLSAAAARSTSALFERHSARIYTFCLRRLGTREEADDAVQQTFLKAFAAARGGFVPTNEKAWLYRVAENVCTDHLRATSKRRRHEAAPEFLASVAAPISPVNAAGICDALADLSEQQRRALVLREWQGLSYREIGQRLSLSQSAVEAVLFRARRSLARRLEAFSFAGALKSALTGGGAVKATAAAVATLTVGTVAVTEATDRTEPTRPSVPTKSKSVSLSVNTPRAPRDEARVAPTRRPRPARRVVPTRAEPRVEVPPAVSAPVSEQRPAGDRGTETQASPQAGPGAGTSIPPAEPPLAKTPPAPTVAAPEVSLPVSVPAPTTVVETVETVVETVVEAAPELTLPETPKLPTLP